MDRIKVGQIGIGHNHGKGKMLGIRKFPELFEVVGYGDNGVDLTDKEGNHIQSDKGYRNILTVADGEIVYRR